MKTIEELRKEFEGKMHQHIKERKLVFNKKMQCFTGIDGLMTVNANWINGAWFMFQELRK